MRVFACAKVKFLCARGCSRGGQAGFYTQVCAGPRVFVLARKFIAGATRQNPRLYVVYFARVAESTLSRRLLSVRVRLRALSRVFLSQGTVYFCPRASAGV